MSVTTANMYVDQGTDFFVNLELLTDQGEDFIADNRSFFCQVRKLYSSSLTFSVECTLTPGFTNSLDLFIESDKTTNVEPGKYQYDVVMVDDINIFQEKILEGLMFIVPSTTKVE